MTNRRLLMQGALASMLGLSHLPNFAQTRLENLRIIVGFPPGGTTDAFPAELLRRCAVLTPTTSWWTTNPAQVGRSA
jgi:hypothetical protein